MTKNTDKTISSSDQTAINNTKHRLLVFIRVR